MIETAIKKPNWIKRILLLVIITPVALLSLAIASIYWVTWDIPEVQIKASADFQKFRTIAQDSIRASMNDPASTQFRNVRQGATPDVVCGEVNARNAFGGYAPFARFYARSTPSPITPQLQIEPLLAKSQREADSFDSNYHSNCGPA